MSTHYYVVAGLRFAVAFEQDKQNGVSLLPSFSPFASDNEACGIPLLFSLTVHSHMTYNSSCDHVRDFDTGNGMTLVCKLTDGGYQYVIRDIRGRSCCLLTTNTDFTDCHCALNGTEDMRSFGLNNAIMLIYAFGGSRHQALLIHASCVVHDGKAYPFIAQSGTGKSTHSSLWLKFIDDCELINDDNPVVRIIDETPILFGSPWSGKTPCYKNKQAPLGAITRIRRAPANSIERLSAVNAFASFLPSCSSMKWDAVIYDNICKTISTIIEKVPSYTLHCLPDKEAAEVCHQTITKG